MDYLTQTVTLHGELTIGTVSSLGLPTPTAVPMLILLIDRCLPVLPAHVGQTSAAFLRGLPIAGLMPGSSMIHPKVGIMATQKTRRAVIG